MHEPFFTTEADEMSRAFDPSNTDAPSGASEGASTGPSGLPVEPVSPRAVTPIHRSVAQHTVCPFCGTVNQASAKACRQCGMENNQSTRTATRSKIGPWFVWQARNPSAPGMNWATLMSLVEKGRVTPRSVVRGPTTGQLWRFAARVKGVSREFGLCWHCGGELQKTARLCPACKRLQQPPANPDVLLETADVGQVPARPPLRDPKDGGLLSLIPEPVRKELPTEAPASAPSNALAAAEEPKPAPEPVIPTSPADRLLDPSVAVIDMGDDPMPSGVEMRAFQLPSDYARGEEPRGIAKRILVAAVLGLAALGGGLYFHPEVRPHYQQWYRSIMSRVSGPDGKRLPRENTGDPATGGHSSTDGGGVAAPLVARHAPTPLMGLTRPVTDTEPVKKAPPQAEISLGPGKSDPAPALLNPPQPQPAIATPPAKPDADAKIQVTPPPSDPQAVERRAWELYERGIKSEQRADYAAAAKEYEWIEQLRLPDGVGPLDVDARLQRAKALAAQKN
jgi:hypothetical protein